MGSPPIGTSITTLTSCGGFLPIGIASTFITGSGPSLPAAAAAYRANSALFEAKRNTLARLVAEFLWSAAHDGAAQTPIEAISSLIVGERPDQKRAKTVIG